MITPNDRPAMRPASEEVMQMAYTTIDYQKRGPVGVLAFNRPEKLNALSSEMKTELKRCLSAAADDPDTRVLILTGKGRAFSAGGDLNNFKEAYEAFRRNKSDDSFADPDLPKAFIDFPKPLIAAVNGPAVGFGLTVSLTCDIRIASQKAFFSCAFVRIGVSPEFGSSYFLPRLVGYGKAAELTLTAQSVDADEALRIGLVNRVVAPEDLMSEALHMAETIGAFSQAAIVKSKALLRHGLQSTLEQVLNYEGLVFRHLMQTEAHYAAVCQTIERLQADNGPVKDRGDDS
jgi:enoyl-CoA hydratase/carnithine racemase